MFAPGGSRKDAYAPLAAQENLAGAVRTALDDGWQIKRVLGNKPVLCPPGKFPSLTFARIEPVEGTNTLIPNLFFQRYLPVYHMTLLNTVFS
jgi:hypothetical protein